MAISMTGFGAADAQWETWICQVEIRSVNQRFLDIRCRLPLGFQTMEPEIKKQIKAVSSRGKIDCSIKLEKGASEEKLKLNLERAQHYNELLTEFEALSGRKVGVDARDLSSLNIIEENKSGEPPEKCEKVIRECLSRALEGLQEMKEREGQAMQSDIQQRLSSCGNIVNSIEKLSQAEPERFRDRLQERFSQLTEGVEINPERLEQEIALLADRLDISEEVVRFRTHLEHMDEIMSQREVGKKAEFLMQELNREVNTMASKSNHAGISQSSVEIKSELEKVREQLQNIE
ncbi:MAG: YicC family protein [SAR324 cluster bacterium]|uniref:YicC family protein n=1 Tax=SAR324 cluster bacterium TaxID=2024889 RepID=A0A432GN67_9DELT|nr:MAG: YicC family protein [SAR324 cluster bacterium]